MFFGCACTAFASPEEIEEEAVRTGGADRITRAIGESVASSVVATRNARTAPVRDRH
jgi:hypothetical protein